MVHLQMQLVVLAAEVTAAVAVAGAGLPVPPAVSIHPSALAQTPTLGGFVWWNYYGYHPPKLYSHYPQNVQQLRDAGHGFGAMRLAAMLQPVPKDAPTGGSRVAMAEYIATQYSAAFLAGAQNQSRWLSSLGVNNRTVLISWNAPDSYTSTDGKTKILPAAHILDYARFIAASVALLVKSGVKAKYVELSNEPDGDWNCRIFPSVFAQLVVAARAEMDAAGMQAVGIAGPGLYVMNEGGYWWPGKGLSASDYFAALATTNAAGVKPLESLAAYSIHTYDDVLHADAPVTFVDSQMRNLSAVIEKVDPGRTKPLIATEWGTATHTLGGTTYKHDVKSDCYSGTDDTIYPDGEALAPAYAARVMAYLLLHFSNGFDEAIVWELADVSGINKPDVGCFGLFDRLGKAKPSGEAVLLLLRRLGGEPKVVKRSWADTEVPTSPKLKNVLTVAVANTGTDHTSHTVAVQHSKASAVTSKDALNCDAAKVVRAVGGGRLSLELPPSCILVLTLPVTKPAAVSTAVGDDKPICRPATHAPPILGECCPGGPLSGPCGGGDDSWCQGVNGTSELPLSCQRRKGKLTGLTQNSQVDPAV
jgi:hypothetical protein